MIEKWDIEDYIGALAIKTFQLEEDNKNLVDTVDRLIDRVSDLEDDTDRLDDRVRDLERG